MQVRHRKTAVERIRGVNGAIRPPPDLHVEVCETAGCSVCQIGPSCFNPQKATSNPQSGRLRASSCLLSVLLPLLQSLNTPDVVVISNDVVRIPVTWIEVDR